MAKAFLKYFLHSEAPVKLGLSSPVIGGEKAEWVKHFDKADYIKEMQEALPAENMREFTNKLQLDVFVGGTYLITNVLEPILKGKEPTLNDLNALWSKNLK